MNDHQLFEYTFIDNHASKTLFLLHGTGGSKDDFLFLNDSLKDTFNLVGLQGNVLEQSNRRFFKRIAEGVFDFKNITEESEKLKRFIKRWKTDNKITDESMYFLGYSNGANMILATLLLHPEIIRTAVLLRPMLPFALLDQLSIPDKTFFITMGEHDPLISEKENTALIDVLKASKAQLQIKKYDTGHQLSKKELNDVLLFLKTN